LMGVERERGGKVKYIFKYGKIILWREIILAKCIIVK